MTDWNQMLPKKYYGSSRPEIVALLPAKVERLLDVGCAEGGFGAAVLAARPGAQVWGVEPIDAPAQAARGRLTQVLHGRFEEGIELPDGFFDVLTFNDSLEHMPDEHAALRLAHRKLSANGSVICSVPNVRYIEHLQELLVDADWRYRDYGILDRTHLRFFTRRSICRTLEECGFKVNAVHGINSHWWRGWKIGLLKAAFGRHVEDMRWKQFIVLASR